MACTKKYTIFVDATKGDDANDGAVAPVKTVKRAFELLYTLPSAMDVTVSLSAEKHLIPQNLQLYAEGMAYVPKSLRIKGVKGKTVLSATTEIDASAFEKVEGKPYYKYQFEGEKFPKFRYLYVNGELQTLAHNGYTHSYDAEVAGSAMYRVPEPFEGIDKVEGVKPPLEFCEKNGYKLYLPKEAVAPITEEECGKVEFHMFIAWYYRVLHIARVDLSDEKEGNVAVYFKPEEMRKWGAMHGFKGNHFFVQNALSFLDEEGEYYYDDKTGALYYYPKEGVALASAVVEYPVTDHMLTFFNLNNVTLEGITVTGNDNRCFEGDSYMGGQTHSSQGPFGPNSRSAIYIKNGKGYTIHDCVFTNLTTNAVKFVGVTRDLTVTDCYFHAIGSTAIDIGEHCGVWGANNGYYHVNENIRVMNNVIDGAGEVTRASVGLYMSVGREVEIAHNTILNTSYSCISVGWRWGQAPWSFGEQTHLYHVDIHHNYFLNFMTDLADGGAIYTLGGNVDKNYHEHFNYVHDNFAWYTKVSWDGKGIVMPYYHDGASSNWHTYNNVQILYPGRRVLAAIYLQNILSQLAHNILVENNEIVAAFKTHEMYSAGKDFEKEAKEAAIFGLDWNRKKEDGSLYTRVDANRWLVDKNTSLYDNPRDLPKEIIERANSTGADAYKPDVEAIIAEMQPIFDAHYARLAEEAAKKAEAEAE